MFLYFFCLLLIPEFCPGGQRQRLTLNKSTPLVELCRSHDYQVTLRLPLHTFRGPGATPHGQVMLSDRLPQTLLTTSFEVLLTSKNWRLQKEGRQSRRHSIEMKWDWLFDKPQSNYSRSPKNPALQLSQKSSKSAFTTPQRPIWNSFATVGAPDIWENGCIGWELPPIILQANQRVLQESRRAIATHNEIS